MKRPHSLKKNPRNQASGFALIARISTRTALDLIAAFRHALPSVATRSAVIASAQTEAQANAKMALMHAIGLLQEFMGFDQPISVNTAVLDTNLQAAPVEGVTHPHRLSACGLTERPEYCENRPTRSNTIHTCLIFGQA